MKGKPEFIAYENNGLLLKRKTQLEMNKYMKIDQKYKKNKTIKNKKSAKNDINTEKEK